MKQLSIAITFAFFAFHSLHPADSSFEERQIAYVETPDPQALPACPLAFLSKPLSTWGRFSGRLSKIVAQYPESVNQPITYARVYASSDNLDPDPSHNTPTLVDLKVGPLPLAVGHLSAKNFELLLKKDANPNLLNQAPNLSITVRTPLASIINDDTCCDWLAKCRLLCLYGADVGIGSFIGNQKQVTHRSPLFSTTALLSNQETVLKGLACAAVLCAYGANKKTVEDELKRTTNILNGGITLLGMLKTEDFLKRVIAEQRLKAAKKFR